MHVRKHQSHPGSKYHLVHIYETHDVYFPIQLFSSLTAGHDTHCVHSGHNYRGQISCFTDMQWYFAIYVWPNS